MGRLLTHNDPPADLLPLRRFAQHQPENRRIGLAAYTLASEPDGGAVIEVLAIEHAENGTGVGRGLQQPVHQVGLEGADLKSLRLECCGVLVRDGLTYVRRQSEYGWQWIPARSAATARVV